MIGALVRSAVALFSPRANSAASWEKIAQQRRQRQEELGKTNRFTPVKRAAHRRAEKNEKDGQT